LAFGHREVLLTSRHREASLQLSCIASALPRERVHWHRVRTKRCTQGMVI